MGDLIRLESLLPDYYDDVIDMHQLAKAEQPQLDDLYASIELSQARLFVTTADSDGLAVFENMLGITLTAASTVDSRRKVVLSRLLDHKPYTMTYLRQLLSTLGGPAAATLAADKYHLQVEVSLDQPNQTDELDRILTTVVPVNLTIESHNTIYANGAGSAYYCGVVATVDIIAGSNDWRGDLGATSVLYGGTTSAYAEVAQANNDWHSTLATSATMPLGGGAVMVEEVRATNDWRAEVGSQVIANSGVAVSSLEIIKATTKEEEG